MKILIASLVVVIFLYLDPAEALTSFVIAPPAGSIPIKHARQPRQAGNIPPVLYDLSYETNVTNRLATTLVTGHIRNSGQKTISVILPAGAFIAGFTLEIGGEIYEAVVKSREDAQNDYNNSTASGQPAGLVEANDVRDSNQFTITINIIDGLQNATFRLVYLQLIQRQGGSYEIITNLFPYEFIENLNVEINIQESRNLVFVRALPFRTGQGSPGTGPNTYVQIARPDTTSAVATFSPPIELQQAIASELGTPGELGFQMIIVFDVERNCSGGDYFQRGSYFMHFFAPCDLEGIPKEIVFVLDTSGSMAGGNKIGQLKSAMDAIMPQLQSNDYVTIVQFTDSYKVFTASGQINIGQTSNVASIANATNVNIINTIIQEFVAVGGTDINTALEVGLNVTRTFKTVQLPNERIEPIIIFLTDGQPSCGSCITDPAEILTSISNQNSGDAKVPIFCLSFGDDADRDFLQKLCTQNDGFARHIYADQDASTQLEDFYKEISSLTLTNLTFTFDNSKGLTKNSFPVFFDGYELVVSGKANARSLPRITATGQQGSVEFTPAVVTALTPLDKHWAYLSLKQILEARDSVENKTKFDQAALNIATNYHFVTPVSPLVLSTPNGLDLVQPANLSKAGTSLGYGIEEDDLPLDEFIADTFEDPIDDPGNGARIYTSGLILFLALFIYYF